jgi:uncharacterized protein (DUF849 family)
LNILSQEVVKQDIKPEFEVFDTGHIDSVMYYVNKHGIPKPPHISSLWASAAPCPAPPKTLLSWPQAA